MLAQERLGVAVRGAREAAGLSVEQVSVRTRIRPALLRELEAGRTARCGGSAYARGHLRALATVTGVDPAGMLAALADLDLEQDVPPDEGRRTGPGPGRRVRPGAARSRAVGRRPGRPVLPTSAREAGRPRWGAAAATAAGVVAVLLLVGGLHGGRAATTEAAMPGYPPGPGLPSRPAPADAVPTAPAPPPPAATLRLQVGHGRSWVTVLTADGRPLFQGVLDAGATRDFTDPSRLSLTVGNAGVVTVGCGGSSAAAGSSARVRRFTCAPAGLAPA